MTMNAEQLLKNLIRAAGSLLELAPPSPPSKRIEDPLARKSFVELYAEGYKEIGENLWENLATWPQRPERAGCELREVSTDHFRRLLRKYPLQEIERAIAELEAQAKLSDGETGPSGAADRTPIGSEQALSASQ